MMASMDGEGGTGRRTLLDAEAGQLFRDVVREGVLRPDDERLAEEHPAHASVQLLVELGLLRLDDERGGWLPVDPATLQAGLVAPMGRQAVELLAESAAWADTLSSLASAFRRTPSSSATHEEIRGLDAINRFLEGAVDDAEEELLTAQPAGPRRAQALAIASSRDLRALERGVRMRTLYQHTARRSRSMRDYVDVMRQKGAEIRTLDEFFNRLIVIDRRLAMIPGETTQTAVIIHDRWLVEYLIDVFERSWERGRDYDKTTRTTESEIAAEIRQLTVRMLTEGHSDSASAKRVGVSTRTYASYVAALKEEYGVQTRFQLGLAMGQKDTESAPDN
ncbi:hypothetical protein SAMN04488570_2669 [Nocardioides scoriae]|uniref:HTH luxR-type domain-containing protein n=2 Tax=Nocardioides scoriae TaxID=642780 RepID=A0A1H1UYP5_9ACTN|nr:hypothetical protein SAMN04488570_2669 [Nocardioides scoriae]